MNAGDKKWPGLEVSPGKHVTICTQNFSQKKLREETIWESWAYIGGWYQNESVVAY